MSTEKINAFIVNRNLFTTLKKTIDFLSKDERINIIVVDQDSTYEPLLNFYEKCDINIHKLGRNEGPYSGWNRELDYIKNDNYFIITDPDCTYDDVPDDWVDVMINVLENSSTFKVGFSIKIDDLPKNQFCDSVYSHESKFWLNKTDFGWNADVDTTFAMYRPKSGFRYDATRLDKPYSLKHEPWYLDKDNITEEWKYYLNNISGYSVWGYRLKSIIGEI